MDTKKYIIYSVTIYTLIMMVIILQMPYIVKYRSWTYFKQWNFKKPNDLLCLPIVTIIVVIISFIITIKLIK